MTDESRADEDSSARMRIREVAQTAGVSAGPVRYSFASKEEPRRACDKHAMEVLTRKQRDALGAASDKLRIPTSDAAARKADSDPPA